MKVLESLNKYKLVARICIITEQSDFSEADLKDAIDLLHKKLFPEHYSELSDDSNNQA